MDTGQKSGAQHKVRETSSAQRAAKATGGGMQSVKSGGKPDGLPAVGSKASGNSNRSGGAAAGATVMRDEANAHPKTLAVGADKKSFTDGDANFLRLLKDPDSSSKGATDGNKGKADKMRTGTQKLGPAKMGGRKAGLDGEAVQKDVSSVTDAENNLTSRDVKPSCQPKGATRGESNGAHLAWGNGQLRNPTNGSTSSLEKPDVTYKNAQCAGMEQSSDTDDDDVDWNEDDEYYEGDEEYVSALQLKVAAASRSKNQFSNFQSISKSTRGGSPTSEIPNEERGGRRKLKMAMTEVAISQTKQQLVRDSLEKITGQPFKFKEFSDYSDSGENLSKNYWMSDNQLRVYGVVRAQGDGDALAPNDIVRRMAVSTLESYGYHATYCGEALDLTDSDFSLAFEHLFRQCFRVEQSPLADPAEVAEKMEQSKELRADEKESLVAIYGDTVIRETIRDRLWKIQLNPAYLKGEELSMEIRFAEGSIYPWEAPFICVSVPSLPKPACLSITGRLVEEARQLSTYGEPFIFTLMDLLENEDEMTAAIKRPPLPLSLPMPSNRGLGSSESLYSGQLCVKHVRREEKGVTPEVVKRNESLKAKFLVKSTNSKYAEMQKYRQTLPAWEFQSVVLTTISKFPVVIVQGTTGCGKSTQIPQYLLDEFLTSTSIPHRSIVCTQPRRISATSVAERIAAERAEKLGEVVGYQIRLESSMSEWTRLLFCTTGLLLQRLESDSSLKSVTHVIIDEVHERSEESDFLLLVCRELLSVRPDLRIILMSATIDSNLFSDYFGGAPVITIPGRTFPVEKLFLEDILDKVDYEHDMESRSWKPQSKMSQRLDEKFESLKLHGKIPPAEDSMPDENLATLQLADRYPRCSERARTALQCMDYSTVNYDLILSIIMWILQHGEPRDEGSILIFLPGIAEITTMLERLENTALTSPSSGKCILLPLHSSLTSEEQSEIFVKPKQGVRKIIAATNLAETSITIEDCVFVIDCGFMKLCRYDPNKEMKSLDTVWISVANALQRAGRAGRVRPGTSFHLYTSYRFRHQLCKQPPPEIDLVSLEPSLMRCKTLPIFKGQSAGNVLAKLPEPPRSESIDECLKRLQHLGAMDSKGELTPLGRHLGSLPVDLRIGKLLLFGAMFRCVDSALTIAACLSYKSPFVSPWKKRQEAQMKKLEWSTGRSDHLTILRAYNAWREACKLSNRAGRVFAEKNFLSVNTLEMLASLKQQYVEHLSSIGFLPSGLSRSVFKRSRNSVDRVLSVTGPKVNENAENYPLLLSVLCASFYPHLVRVLRPDQRYNKSGSGAVLAAPHPSELKFLTRNDEKVRIHPSSVLHTQGFYDSPYVIFHDKMKTSNVFILECSMVPAFPLILCGGSEIRVCLHRGRFVIELDDGWIKFLCDSQQVAELLAALRKQLDGLLIEKIRNPLLDLCNDVKSDALLSTISTLLINPTSE